MTRLFLLMVGAVMLVGCNHRDQNSGTVMKGQVCLYRSTTPDGFKGIGCKEYFPEAQYDTILDSAANRKRLIGVYGRWEGYNPRTIPDAPEVPDFVKCQRFDTLLLVKDFYAPCKKEKK